MGEYEPDDSRTVTQSPHRAPGEPPRTGPREDEARAKARGQKRPEEQQGLADAEPQDKPTARDARGNKQSGYAAEGEASEEAPFGK
jgi:hypothetical protein